MYMGKFVCGNPACKKVFAGSDDGFSVSECPHCGAGANSSHPEPERTDRGVEPVDYDARKELCQQQCSTGL